MNVIYISGPYRADTECEVEDNIRSAEDASLKLLARGWAPICPHKNFARFGGRFHDTTFMEADLSILRKADAVFMLEGWEDSEGSKSERFVAQFAGIPIYYRIEDVPEEKI